VKATTAVFALLILCRLLSLSPTPLLADQKTSQKAYQKEYSFTVNTFTDRIPSWTRLLGGFRGKPDITYLEIGAFEGRSALWIAENIFTHPTSKLTIIDAFLENNHKRFLANVALSGEASRFNILSGLSTQIIIEIPLVSFEVDYIDV
jgi:hypothetical protein